MHTKATLWKIPTALLALLVAIGCSKQSTDSPSTESDAEAAPVASKKMTSDIDKMCQEILQSSDKREAADWVKRYPKSSVGEDEEGRPIPLASLVARFRDAGADRIVIECAKIGQGEFLVGVVVVLPTDAPARQKLFAIDPELSQLCQQTPVKDYGQKYLHYSFD